MKTGFVAIALAVASSCTLAAAPAAPDAPANGTTVVADAGRLTAASLDTLNDGTPWANTDSRGPNATMGWSRLDAGVLLVIAGVCGLALWRPASHALRRQAQQRRAAALASTLQSAPRD